MRPVNKGVAPEKEYKHYQDAEPDLEARLGPYCSFCEMVIHHVPEVEHREAKSAGGELLKWIIYYWPVSTVILEKERA